MAERESLRAHFDRARQGVPWTPASVTRVTPWLLLDYGDVISLAVRRAGARRGRAPARPDARASWGAVLGQPRSPRLRPADGVPYWSGVAGRDVSDDEAARLDAVDLGGWARVNARRARARRGAAPAGVRLALLSNAPHVQAEAFEQVEWTQPFEHVFVSARLGMVKPDPAIFEHVLQRARRAAPRTSPSSTTVPPTSRRRRRSGSGACCSPASRSCARALD